MPYNVSDVIVILGFHIDYSASLENVDKALLLERCLRKVSNQCKLDVKLNIINALLVKTYDERVTSIKSLLGDIEIAEFKAA